MQKEPNRLGYTPHLVSNDPNDIIIKTIHHLSWKEKRKLYNREKHTLKDSIHYRHGQQSGSIVPVLPAQQDTKFGSTPY